MGYRRQTEAYWDKSAKGYSKNISSELVRDERKIWTELILENAPDKECLRVLDIGTGPGFFSIILSVQGHQVTGIDCTPAMLEEAKQNAEKEGVSPDFRLMDVHSLDFPDGAFDLVVSRNVTWTLYDPEKAYREWKRVLKPGGRILVFDANWYMNFFDRKIQETMYQGVREYREKYDTIPVRFAMFQVEEYWRHLPMVGTMRPLWDRAAFWKLGLQDIVCEENIAPRVQVDDIHSKIYGSAPMFMIRGTRVSEEEEDRNDIREHWDGRALVDGVLAVGAVTGGNDYYEHFITPCLTKKGARILDVGCGAGMLSVLMMKDGHEVTGLDFSVRMLEEAAYTAEKAGIRSPRFLAGNAEELPFSDEEYDVVVLKDVLRQLQNPEKVLHECNRVLKRGGKLLIADANRYLHRVNGNEAKAYREKWSPVSESTLHLVYDTGSGRSSVIDLLAERLPLTMIRRPDWEIQLLEAMGYEKESMTEIPESEEQIPSFVLTMRKKE